MLPDASTLQLVSLRSLKGMPGEVVDWHDHPFHEFTLVSEGSAEIAYPPGWRHAPANTLFFYLAGERHGARLSPRQRAHFSVIHLRVPETWTDQPKFLREGNPARRVWKLSVDQAESFRWIFFQLMNERNASQAHQEMALSAWLQILLLNVSRWSRKIKGPEIAPALKASPEVRRLWQAIHDSVSNPDENIREISAMPNYDSVRHAFRRIFGCSPREMLLRLRMEQARNLLLESNLSIKEISEKTGYRRQHEFYRAFHRRVGCSPTEWRANPVRWSR